MLRLIRPAISDIIPYNAKTIPCRVKLDIMEGPYDLPPGIKSKIQNAVERIHFNRYPDPEAIALKKSLADYTGVPLEMIYVGNGSDELILSLLLAFGGEGRKAIFPEPSFPIYSLLAKITSTEPCPIPLAEGFELNDSKIIDAAKEKPSIIFIAYPNNPTGNCFQKESLLRIIRETEALVVIDEAYYEFSKESLVNALSLYKNLVILRTFSKAFGLAAIRCGYLLANLEVITQINKVKPPYNLNSLSQEIALILLSERGWMEKVRDELISQRDELYNELLKIKTIKPYPSKTNFIYFETENPGRVYSKLLADGILIKQVAGGLRVTIGKPEENQAFLDNLTFISSTLDTKSVNRINLDTKPKSYKL
ncbi:histidinol-phosphate transaminase [bacterium]|nr:histidinol-phosphate transaminase [bacterium]